VGRQGYKTSQAGGMLSKKICMIGSLAVGKTALVQRFVRSIFSDDYLSSVGVKVSKKTLDIGGETLNLMLWDLEGQDDYHSVNISYIKGASGLFFVVDGTRGSTLSVALMLRNTALDILGHDTPHLLIINKDDLSDKWEITEKVIDSLKNSGLEVLKTSARTGLNVELAFSALSAKMMGRS
jgi:small GTP-binding protein